MAITLYQFAYSPYAAKVRKCLELKRLAFDVIEVPYMDRRDVVRLTGQVVVPILTDGDLAIADSPRITAHLDERYPPNLRTQPAAASAFETWSDTIFEDVAFRIATPVVVTKLAALNGGRADAPAMYRFVKERKFGPGCVDAWAATARELIARLRTLAAPLAETVAVQPYLLGDTPSLADAAVYGNFYMLEWAMPGWIERELPALAGWYARVHAAT